MTSRHQRAPLRRSSTPERILTAGLATATCVGVVGLLGVRTIEANAASSEAPAAVDLAVSPSDGSSASLATSSTGLTEAQLDAYAADLAREKERLDAYRAKLVKTAKKLSRQAERQGRVIAAPRPISTGTSSAGSAPSTKPSPASKGNAASKSSKGASAPQQQAAAPQPVAEAPQQQATKPAPAAASAPSQKQPPAQQQASSGGQAQSNTKGS